MYIINPASGLLSSPNPIQPILGLSEIIRSRKSASDNITDKGDDEELFDVIIGNIRLSENILDVTKI